MLAEGKLKKSSKPHNLFPQANNLRLQSFDLNVGTILTITDMERSRKNSIKANFPIVQTTRNYSPQDKITAVTSTGNELNGSHIGFYTNICKPK